MAAPVLVGSILLGLPRSGPAGPPPVFADVIQVHVANVDVVVHDRQGRPVTGLHRDDFELLVDGRPVPISNFFSAIRDEMVPSAATPAAPPAVAGGTPGSGGDRADGIPEDQRLHLVVVVDLGRGGPRERATALSHVQNLLLKDLAPGARVAVAAVDRGVTLRQSFTADRPAAVAALEALKGEAGGGLLADASYGALINRMERARQSGDNLALEAQRLEQDVRAFAEESRMLTKVMARELADFVDSLAGLPGRKVVLLLSGGMPVRESEALFEAWAVAFPSIQRQRRAPLTPQLEARQFDASPELDAVIRRANAGRVAFFSVDLGSLQAGTEVDAGTFSPLVRDTAAIRWQDAMDGLVRLAGGTGGRTLQNGPQSILGAAELLDDLGTYYSLGFEPRPGDVGRHRRVQVVIRTPGLRVRHSERILIKSPEERLGDRVNAGLHFGQAENPLDVGVADGGDHRLRGRTVEVPLLISIPAAKLALVPLDGALRGRLTVVLGVRDPEGRRSALHHQTVNVSLPATGTDRVLGYRVPVRLKPGEATVAVLVHDDLAAVSSLATLAVDAGAGPPKPGQ